MAKDSDIKFVNALYNAANEVISFKVNILFWIIVSIVTSLLIWGNVAEVDELTRGEGKVIPSSKMQKIQYFDGGIISAILVKEGAIVKKGQDLMLIDTTRVKATLEETKASLYALEVEKIRLEKEMDVDYINLKLPNLTFPKRLKEKASQYINIQKQIFRNNFNERTKSLEILFLQKKQKKGELLEVRSKIKQLTLSAELIAENYKTIKRMVRSGSKSKVDLINIKKEKNDVLSELRTSKLSIDRSKSAINESNKQIEEKVQTFKVETSKRLQEIIGEMKKTEFRLVSDKDKLKRTVIKSPVNGIVKTINVATIGGTVQSGTELIEIIPESKDLLIEAKIKPKDIPFINPSLKALVKLTAYDFSVYGGLDASIVEISADSFIDERSQNKQPYYKVIVKTDKNYLEHNGKKMTIIPGMIASVDIVTGKKTIIDFILKPILKVKQGALHER